MRACGLGHLLDRPVAKTAEGGLGGSAGSGNAFRRRLLCTVLATDMSVHGEFMRRWACLVDGWERGQCSAERPRHNEEEMEERRALVCQAIIKCADISNPVRHELF